jgi:hypothetical protein
VRFRNAVVHVLPQTATVLSRDPPEHSLLLALSNPVLPHPMKHLVLQVRINTGYLRRLLLLLLLLLFLSHVQPLRPGSHCLLRACWCPIDSLERGMWDASCGSNSWLPSLLSGPEAHHRTPQMKPMGHQLHSHGWNDAVEVVRTIDHCREAGLRFHLR